MDLEKYTKGFLEDGEFLEEISEIKFFNARIELIKDQEKGKTIIDGYEFILTIVDKKTIPPHHECQILHKDKKITGTLSRKQDHLYLLYLDEEERVL